MSPELLLVSVDPLDDKYLRDGQWLFSSVGDGCLESTVSVCVCVWCAQRTRDDHTGKYTPLSLTTIEEESSC